MYFLSIVVYFKNERSHLLEWILHYKKWGIDHIFMIDNGSQDNYKDIVNKYIEEGFITLWKEPKLGQYQSYLKYFPIMKKRTKWLGVLDTDEFLYSKEKKDLKSVLKKIPNHIKIISIQMKIFYPSSFLSPPSIIEENRMIKGNDNINFPKCIFKISQLNTISIHGINELRRLRWKFKKIIILPNNLLCINHYRYSSFEHLYGIKEGRGGGVHKLKYKKPLILKKEELRDICIKDNYLVEHSKELINFCKKNYITPKIELYPNSSWIKLKEKYPEKYKKFSNLKDLNINQIYNINSFINSIL